MNIFEPKRRILLLQKCNCKLHQLPVISRNDIMSKYVLGTPGEIIKIIRTSKMTGGYPFYRFIKMLV